VIMSSYVAIRKETAYMTQVTWVDDLKIVIEEDIVAKVRADFDYFKADVRLVLQRGTQEMILGSGLFCDLDNHAFEGGDELKLQWRAWSPATSARSTNIQLRVDEIVE